MKLIHALNPFKLILFGTILFFTCFFTGCEDDIDGNVHSNDDNTTANFTYPIVNTKQGFCYNNNKSQIDGPSEGEAF